MAGTQNLTPDQDRALETLVAQGTLTGEQAHAVRSAFVVKGTRAAGPGAVLTEVAGYVGGGLMLGGAALLVSLNWTQLGRRGAVLVLVGYALALIVAAVLVAGGPQRIVGLRSGQSPVRRRLVAVLLAVSSGPAAMAAGISIDDNPGIIGGIVGLLVAVAAYALLPSIPAILATATMSVVTTIGLINLNDDPHDHLWTIAFVTLGALWALVASVGLITPRHIGLSLGAIFGVFGAQMYLAFDEPSAWAYGATAGVAALCFIGYWLDGSTTLLALGVVAMTIAVPEAVIDWTNDSLNGPAILLISGGVLVAASALGLWLRSARSAPPTPAV